MRQGFGFWVKLGEPYIFSKSVKWSEFYIVIVNTVGAVSLYTIYFLSPQYTEGHIDKRLLVPTLYAIFTVLCIYILRLKSNNGTVLGGKVNRVTCDKESVDVEKDILTIKMSNDEQQHVDLSKNKLYICNNDNILMISKGEHREKRLDKEDIKIIQIKNIDIKYGSAGWKMIESIPVVEKPKK